MQAMQSSMYELKRWWISRKAELKNNLTETLALFSASAHKSWLTFGSDLDRAAEKLLRRAAPRAGASSRAEKANVDATNDVLIIDDSAAAAVGAAVGGASAARETSSRVGEDAGPSAGGGSSSGRGRGVGVGGGASTARETSSRATSRLDAQNAAVYSRREANGPADKRSEKEQRESNPRPPSESSPRPPVSVGGEGGGSSSGAEKEKRGRGRPRGSKNRWKTFHLSVFCKTCKENVSNYTRFCKRCKQCARHWPRVAEMKVGTDVMVDYEGWRPGKIMKLEQVRGKSGCSVNIQLDHGTTNQEWFEFSGTDLCLAQPSCRECTFCRDCCECNNDQARAARVGNRRRGVGKGRVDSSWDHIQCRECGNTKDEDSMILCDACDAGYHLYCLDPPLQTVPEGEWLCADCVPERKRMSCTLLSREQDPLRAREKKLEQQVDEPKASSSSTDSALSNERMRRSGPADFDEQRDVSKRHKMSHGGEGPSSASAPDGGGGGGGGSSGGGGGRRRKKRWQTLVDSGRLRERDEVRYKDRRAYLTADFQVKDAGGDDVWQDPLAWALVRKDYDDTNQNLTSYWRSIYHTDDRHVDSSKFYCMRLGQSSKDFRSAREALAGRYAI